MVSDPMESLVGIVIGIRFRANFSVEDQLGNIVDTVLYSKDSFFNPSVFPEVYSDVNERVLVNKDADNHLRINSSNIILEMNLKDGLDRKYISRINDRFYHEIIRGIMKQYKITQINRVGYIKKYLFKIEELARGFLDKTLGNTLEGINDIILRFSKRYPVQEALIKNGVKDYYNAIFNIVKRANTRDLFISVDYQRYFDPFLVSSSQLEFKDFIKRAEDYNSKDFLTWLNKYCSNES